MSLHRQTLLRFSSENVFIIILSQGVIMNKSDGTLTVMTEKHNNLTASAADHLSDEELNVMDEVELTVLTVSEIRLFVSPVRHFAFCLY